MGFAVESANVLVLGTWFVLAGLGIACMETAEHSTVATNAADDVRGSAFGLLAAVQSFGNLAASAVAGVIWTAISPAAAFLYLATLMIVAVALLARARLVALHS